MSGTSLDGVDLAFASFSLNENGAWECKPGESMTVPFSETWRTRLSELSRQSAEIFAKTHVDFGHYLGKLTADFIREFDLHPDFVASHGHTIFHQPNNGFTTQIGDGETMVSLLEIPLVNNFRNKNLALSGEGAPLVPFGEGQLFPNNQVFLNLGGISNVGYNALGFDISICNIALNYLASQYDSSLNFDPDGKIARSGSLDEALLDKLNDFNYFNSPPPKSLGIEWFLQNQMPVLQSYINTDLNKIPHALHTFSEHISLQIFQALTVSGSDKKEIFVTGGGAKNLLLMEKLREKGVLLKEFENPAWIDFKEAIIFAFLGLQVLLGRKNTLASVTGAKMDALCGSIHLPASGGFPIFKAE